MGPPDARLDRMVALAGRSVKIVIPPRAAWLMSQLLRRVVTKSPAPSLRSSGLLVAGNVTPSPNLHAQITGRSGRVRCSWSPTRKHQRRRRPEG